MSLTGAAVYVSMMRKIHFKSSLDALYRWIEITIPEIWEFFSNQFLQLLYTHKLTGIGYTYFTKVPIGIDIEIAPLYHF